MEVNELRRQYAEGKRDFGFADLSGLTLTGINLSGAAFYQANFAKATLVDVNFSRANLRQANLQGANLSQANLQQANLRRANLTGAILDGAVLDGAIFTGATMPEGALYQVSAVVEEDQPVVEEPLVAPLPQKAATAMAYSLPTSTAQQPRQIAFWAPLLFLGLGFSLFGMLLALHQASFVNWLIAWSGAIVWLLGESLMFFIPMIAAIAVLNSAGISVITLGTSGLVTPTLFIILKFFLDQDIQKALIGSIWVGGIAAILVQIASWMFYGGNAYGGGGIVVAFDTFHLALLLVLAIGLTSLGMVAWRQMLTDGFTKSQVVGVVGGVAAIALACGKALAATTGLSG